jgi:hypothetical protein
MTRHVSEDYRASAKCPMGFLQERLRKGSSDEPVLQGEYPSRSFEPGCFQVTSRRAKGAGSPADFSVLAHCSEPPMLVVHGNRDAFVPYSESVLCTEAMTRANARYDFHTSPQRLL